VTEPRKIVTGYNDIWREWHAHDENYEPADSDGVGGWPLGTGATEAEAIADLHEQEAEDD